MTLVMFVSSGNHNTTKYHTAFLTSGHHAGEGHYDYITYSPLFLAHALLTKSCAQYAPQEETGSPPPFPSMEMVSDDRSWGEHSVDGGG